MATEGTQRDMWRCVEGKSKKMDDGSTGIKGDGEKVGKAQTDPPMHTPAPLSCSSVTAPQSLDLGPSTSIMRPPCHRTKRAFGSRIRREDSQMSTLPLPPYPDYSR